MLAPGLSLSLGLGLAGDGAAVMQDWYEQDLAACTRAPIADLRVTVRFAGYDRP